MYPLTSTETQLDFSGIYEPPFGAGGKTMNAIIGHRIAELLTPPKFLILRGDLGAGKTTLAKGIAEALDAAEPDEVTSPTFTLVHIYGKAAKVFHADLYRIESFHDFETLGMEDMFAEPGVAILEWSERFPLEAPWPQVRLKLEHLGGDSRRITLS